MKDRHFLLAIFRPRFKAVDKKKETDEEDGRLWSKQVEDLIVNI